MRASAATIWLSGWIARPKASPKWAREGANWIGEAPFSTREHVYQNIGDGTYIHSGSLAIRAAVAAGTNVTYKLLYNDAVAMTGGQSLDGTPSVAQMARQLAAEGAKRVVIVSDEPDKYPSTDDFPAGTTVHHREDLDSVQSKLRDIEGVTVLIYDQTCAAEKTAAAQTRALSRST